MGLAGFLEICLVHPSKIIEEKKGLDFGRERKDIASIKWAGQGDGLERD